MTPDEKNLVHGFCSGQADSFDRLYDTYSPRIYRFCLRLCRSRADAEDLTQEVFLAAYQGIHRFDRRSSVATWLYRIALYRWRSLSRVNRPETVPLDETETPNAPDPTIARLDRVSLDRALSALPQDQRVAFLLVKEEQLLCREAAEVLNISEGTLRSRVHAAVIRLRKLLSSETVEEGLQVQPQSVPAGQGGRACPSVGRTSPAPTCRRADSTGKELS